MRILIFIALLCVAAQGRGQIYIDSYRFAAAATFFLDDYPTSEVAFSLRKLRQAYDGNCIEVLKDSTGDATQNIGFVNNYLDTVALKNFCKTNLCRVKTWYDQSGNGNDVLQSTKANMPTITSVSGAINYEKNYPAVNFDGSNDRLINNNVATPFSGTDEMIFGCIVQKCTFNNAQGALYGFGSNANATPLRWLGSSDANSNIRLQERDDALNIRTTSGGNITTYSVLVVRTNMDNSEVWANNISTLSNTMAAGATTLNLFNVGALQRLSTGEAFYSGNIQELILYNADKASDRTAMQTNINTFYSIY